MRTTTNSQFGGQKVFEVENYLFGFFPASVTFFNTERGTVEFSAEGQTGMWYQWSKLRPGAEVAVSLPPFAPDCVHGAEGSMAIGGPVEVPAGVFENVALITYGIRPCEDHAVLSEVMASGVGLIQRRVLTFAGLQTWSLEYAEIDGRVYGRLSSNENRAAAGRADGGLSSSAAEEASTWGAIKAAFRP